MPDLNAFNPPARVVHPTILSFTMVYRRYRNLCFFLDPHRHFIVFYAFLVQILESKGLTEKRTQR